MANLLHYKGYVGSIEYIEEKEIFYGKLEFIKDLITFQGASVKELKKDFHELGKEPEKLFKGRFPARINPELHRRAAFMALRQDISLNKYVEKALEQAVENDSRHGD
jgi:predicted HicB family RNase H-like nuclease